MRHNQRANHASRQAPAGRVYMFPRALRRLECHFKGFREVLPQVMRRPCLQRLSISHHRFN